MKNVLSIINTKSSTLEFEVNIDGFEPSKVDVCLCIKTKDYYLKFPCKKNKSNWECKIPALGHVEKGAYPYVIEVVADGYHFEAMSGTANLVGSFDVYAKKPEKLVPGAEEKKEVKKESPEEKKTTPIKKKVEKKEVKKEDVDLKDKGFSDLVDRIFNQKKEKKEEKPLIERQEKVIGKNKDDVVKKIVVESNKAPKEEPKIEPQKTIFKKVEKKPEPEKKAIDTKADMVKKIVTETKDSKTKLPPRVKVSEEDKKPIIQKEEPKKKVLEEKVQPKSEKDGNIKDILKNLSQPVEEHIQESVLPFKKGKRVVH